MLATVWKITQPILILVSVIKKITSREKGGDVMDKLVKNPSGPDGWLQVPSESSSFCDVQTDAVCRS